ncbi:MAG: tetratricopeptide repeat-containing sensor histidine kinase [Mucilaginibacter sp.]
MRQICFFLWLILLPAVACSQLSLTNQRIVDSLTWLVNKAAEDSSKVDLLSNLSKKYYPIDYKKGLEYGNRALSLAKKIGWKQGVMRAYSSLAANYWARNDFMRAQDFYGESLKVAREISNKMFIAINLHDIGICYDVTGNSEKAVAYYKESIAAASANGFKELEMGTYSNIADLYSNEKKYDEALSYYHRSLKLSGQINKPLNGGYYIQKIGLIYSYKGDQDKALEYVNKAIKLFEKLGNDEGVAFCLNEQSRLYVAKKEPAQAIKQCLRALNMLAQLKGTPTQKMQSSFNLTLGNAYAQAAKQSQGKQAINFLQLAVKSYGRAVSIDKAINYRESAANGLKGLSESLEALGRHNEALQVYKEYAASNDSINNSEKLKDYTRHELAFEYARRHDSLNYEARLQKQEMAQVRAAADSKVKQRSLYGVVAIVVLLLISSYFFFRARVQQIRFKSQLANEKAQQQIKDMGFESKLNDLTLASLKSQMNPHFIFNCLNSIKFYVEKNETDAASLYITKFSRLIRSILDSARSEKISLATELELIRLYLEMEAMRLKEKLRYQIDVADDIDAEFIEIPPLLIQPYVENAIWHGLMPKQEGGVIKIDVKIVNSCLLITIADDGIGREQAGVLKKKNKFNHASHGSALNNERIAMFNARYKTNTRVDITDLYNHAGIACGTLVTIKMLLQ